MSILLPEKSSQDFELTPSGSHVAVCYRIVDLGTQLVEYKGESKKQHKIMLSWELCDEFMKEGKNEGLPFSIHKRYTLSSHEKATLRKDLESWRGKPFTDDDLGKFNIGVLLGIGCLLGVVQTERNGKVYANLNSIMRLPKGMESKAPVNPTVYFSLNEFDQELYNALSENLKNTIAMSPEYQAIKGINQNSSNISDDHFDPNSYDETIPF